MLYSTIIVAASALVGFASAQNSSSTYGACCSVPVNNIPQSSRSDWCAANLNTCVELCGGQGSISSNGNTCTATDLKYQCKCSNGTDVTSAMSMYQQTVPGLMCRFWYDGCVNATVGDAAAQFQCVQTRDSKCGNRTTDKASQTGSMTASGTSKPTDSSSSSSSTEAAKSSAAAAHMAVYATPALAGGLLALFGFAL